MLTFQMRLYPWAIRLLPLLSLLAVTFILMGACDPYSGGGSGGN